MKHWTLIPLTLTKQTAALLLNTQRHHLSPLQPTSSFSSQPPSSPPLLHHSTALHPRRNSPPSQRPYNLRSPPPPSISTASSIHLPPPSTSLLHHVCLLLKPLFYITSPLPRQPSFVTAVLVISPPQAPKPPFAQGGMPTGDKRNFNSNNNATNQPQRLINADQKRRKIEQQRRSLPIASGM
ncbi:hypothetical protein HanPSC8_Chr10g0438491 [Helianthus annuus]|uniref:Uncharacterized protein n=1 Tax=Helianthus annuus TaxID=4232 RepID=A0A251TMN7_HELAN|nr:hypothetical protein HanPSC8_Chr10g0438491 [Helianthus annuus]